MRIKSRGPGTSLGRERFFNITVKLVATNEVFTLKNMYNEMKISQLKSYAEFATGIPKHIQRLQYLDQGDLLDNSDIRQNDIVPNAQIHMDVWSTWTQLIEAVASNDMDWLFKLGVSQESDYKTPNSEYMLRKHKRQWLADRAFVALYIAAHRGYQKMCEKLIAAGADVNAATPLGRSPLHVAAAQGHGSIVDALLEKGADINAEDENGESALAVANKFGHKGCERHLFLFRWQQRAKQTEKLEPHPLFAHQYFDSATPVWREGTEGQIYFAQILPPGEFEGSALAAPKRPPTAASSSLTSEYSSEEEEGGYEPSGPGTPTRDGGLTAIREETESVKKEKKEKRKSKRQEERERTFDEWLKKKEIKEAIDRAERQELARQKKAASDDNSFGFSMPELSKIGTKEALLDWEAETEEQDSVLNNPLVSVKPIKTDAPKKAAKMQAEMQDKSYDQWLAEKEASNKKQKNPDKVTQATGGKTTDDIIRGILDKKTQESGGSGGFSGIPSDLWKSVRDPAKYNEIQIRGGMLLDHYTQQQEAMARRLESS